jgi:membrane protease YdiL (CAAX protease family)
MNDSLRPAYPADSIRALLVCILVHLVGNFLTRHTQSPFLLGAIQVLVQTSWPVMIVVLCALRRIDLADASSLRLPSWRGVALGALVAVSMFWLLKAWVPVQNSIFEYFGSKPDYREAEQLKQEFRESGVLMALCTASIWVPFREEFLFRGVALSGLARGWGIAAGIAVTAVVFGVLHESLGRFFITAALGASFGFLVYCTRSVWVAMLAHGINNGMAIYSDRDPGGLLVAASLLVIFLTVPALLVEKSRREHSFQP